jgi:two-component system sensor histidine kinase CiaH
MFQSTTLRLTGWYLLILMSLSILFSIFIFQIASSEIRTRLDNFQISLQESPNSMPPPRILTLGASTVSEADANLSIQLVYINLLVLFIGGFVSYYLARRSLLPIERAHEAQSRFTSDASHELRTPLAIMKTELEVALKDKNATTDSLKEVLSSNLEEVDKLSRMAEVLLNLSQLDHAKLKPGPVNLNKVSLNVIKDFKEPASRISLTSKKKLIINGNEIAIADLIKVLVENALQYSPKDSLISVKLSRQDQYGKFEITNAGPGVQPDTLPYIFDRFFRADSSRSSGKNKGYGFGLALAKNIIELHGGELIASSIPNKETTFTFLIPLYSKTQAKNQN